MDYKRYFQGQKGPIWTFVIYLGQYLRNGACCDQCLYEAHIQSHIWSFSWPCDLWPWITFKGQIKVTDFQGVASHKWCSIWSISLTNGRQSIRMRLMPWSGNLLKHPYLDDFSEPCCLEVDASLKGLYHTSVGMLRGLLKLQKHWMVYLDDIHTHTWTTSVNHVA